MPLFLGDDMFFYSKKEWKQPLTFIGIGLGMGG